MSAMKIYQRMLYVGLGGTGLKIGSQLEAALRSELCGPDGMGLVGGGFPKPLEPYQLPSCLQFVYFDFDESARNEAKKASAQRTGEAVAAQTSQAVGNLTPTQNSYRKVASMLRIEAQESVASWLPDAGGEPKEPQVAPLTKGAGELPTVGRAALFETFRAAGGGHPVTRPLNDALARLSAADGDLTALAGGAALSGYDIFVGFSVAGGTGAGVFYDVLRLVADLVEDALQDATNEARIYPLVVLPSAFAQEYAEKRRFHMLNGGPALRELFELIDNANTGIDNRPVIYPGDTTQKITPEVPTPTAFLFNRPETVSLDDLHRSVVSFVVSVIGTTIDEGADVQNARPLSANLIDESKYVGELSPDGIGRHPAATALAAEIRIPLEQISEIIAQRLLAQATRQLRDPVPNEQSEGPAFDKFAGASGLDVLVDRRADEELPERKAEGAKEINEYLRARNKAAIERHKTFAVNLKPRLEKLSAQFDWGAGFSSLLSEYNLFRASRIVLGHPKLNTDLSQAGFNGFIYRRGEIPPDNPENFTDTPPTPPDLKDRLKGLSKLGQNSQKVVESLRRQNRWYEWRIKQEWYESWKAYRPNWDQRARAMRQRLESIVDAFSVQANGEAASFTKECQGLYRDHTGVVYFLPDGGPGNDLDQWYRTAVVPRLCDELKLPEGSEPSRIVSQIMGGKWLAAYEQTKNGPPEGACRFVLKEVRDVIRSVLAADQGHPLMPPIQTLLRRAAYAGSDALNESSEDVSTVALRELFVNSLAGLLPADFRPAGSGPLGIEVFYPSSQRDGQIEHFLAQTCVSSLAGTIRYHPLANVDFVSVVLRRLSQSATSVGEYRELMAVRAEALAKPKLGDQLPWRQRLGYDPTWLVLRPDERARVLFAFLNALYDGSIQVVSGTAEQPDVVHLHQAEAPSAGPMELQFRPARGGGSSWSDIVCAYERYALSGDQEALARCGALLARRGPTQTEPSELYRSFMAMRAKQSSLAEALATKISTERDRKATAPPLEYEFWMHILPAAMTIETSVEKTHTQLADMLIVEARV